MMTKVPEPKIIHLIEVHYALIFFLLFMDVLSVAALCGLNLLCSRDAAEKQ